MAYQDSKVRGADKPSFNPIDIKYTILKTADAIVNSAPASFDGEDLTGLFRWGARIEMFDAYLFMYWKKDDEYKRYRNKLEERIHKISLYDVRRKNELFRLYKLWFSALSEKLAYFKIYPPLPSAYAQGVGEVNEADEKE